MPKKYVSRAIVSLGDPASFQGRDVRVIVDDTINMTFSRTSLLGIIQSEKLYPELQRQAPMEDVVAQMRRQVDVHVMNAPKSTHLTPISVQFAYSDPETAERVTGAMLSMLVSDFGRLKLPVRGVQTLDPPSRPVQPVSPKIPLVLLAGLLGGVLLGAAAFGVIRLTRAWQTA
jgi:capsular polysaccharide biosynthesis protein